jgi:AcrR family transcriptional regulator
MTQLALDITNEILPEKNPYARQDNAAAPEQQRPPQAPEKQEAKPEPRPQPKAEPKLEPRQDREIEELKKKYRKGRPRSEKSRAAILKATNQLLQHTSVQELSIEAIAKRAKVGKTTIYRWWPNKTAVVMEALSSQPALQEPLAPAPNNTVALELQLEKLIRLLHSKNGQTIAQLFSEAQGNEKSQEIFENSFLSPLLDAIEFSIEEGKKGGEFNPRLPTKLAIDMLCGPIFFRLMAHPADFDVDFERVFPKQVVRLITV